MAFVPVERKQPTSIGDVVISIRQGADGSVTARYEVAVLDQNGDVLSLERGDLLEVADEASQATLAAELASLRAKANEDMLPESQ